MTRHSSYVFHHSFIALVFHHNPYAGMIQSQVLWVGSSTSLSAFYKDSPSGPTDYSFAAFIIALEGPEWQAFDLVD